MRDGFLSMGHGRALINVDKREEQLDLYHKIIKGDLSVRKTEALVKGLKTQLKRRKSFIRQHSLKKASQIFQLFLGLKFQLPSAKMAKEQSTFRLLRNRNLAA